MVGGELVEFPTNNKYLHNLKLDFISRLLLFIGTLSILSVRYVNWDVKNLDFSTYQIKKYIKILKLRNRWK